jgi:short-subunit dehydrogenase
MENRESVIVVTGASSGIGNACATLLAKKGKRVYGTCRSPASYSRKADEFFEMLPMDLCDESSIVKAAERILGAEGRVDSLVCCAGSGLVGSIEAVGIEEAQALMDVNFFGTLRTIKAFLPAMREARKGRIIILGSVEGIVAAPYQGIFSACEHALEGLAASLRIEASAFGIEIGLLELGSFRTAFGQKRRMISSGPGSDPYSAGFESAISVLARDEAMGLDPLDAARIIQSMLAARRLPPREMLCRFGRRYLVHARRVLSPRAFEKRLKRYYGLK